MKLMQVLSGLIYRKNKPVYWSPSSGTALAEAELEYMDDHRSTAAFVAFPILTMAAPALIKRKIFDDVSLVIWTTTPWTLPANRAVAVNEKLFYVVLECSFNENQTQRFLVEDSRVEYFKNHLKARFTDVTATVVIQMVSGASLIGATYGNPLIPGRPLPVVHADFVSSTSGTGVVHMAPGHGMEDYEVCNKYGITPFAPVDELGRFTEKAVPMQPDLFAGKFVQEDGVEAVLKYLEHRGQRFNTHFLLVTHEILHRYPIDWRTKKPVIIRATEQWFADVESIKGPATAALAGVQFIPDSGKSRLESFISSRSQWCISRQRAWGVPIPALYRTDDGSNKAVMDESTIHHIMRVIEERGTDAWWTDADDDRAWIPPQLEGSHVRGKDTMDVWFDSGTSWTLLNKRQSPEPLADVYLEGTDQHRGWFQSSLLTHVADQNGSAPFKTLITHGFTLDQDGRKMSKSLGNVISPDEITSGTLLPPLKSKKKTSENDKPSYDAWGPDALRLWVASSDYTRDIVIGKQVLQTVNSTLQKYRITLKWLLGCLDDFNASQHLSKASDNEMRLMDRIALHQLSQTSKTVHEAYLNYGFYKVSKTLEAYVNSDLSAFYFETLKDRLYTGTREDRVAAQAVLYHIFQQLLSMLGPITPLMVEETWKYAPHALKHVNVEPSIESSQETALDSFHPLRTAWKPYLAPWVDDAESTRQLERSIEEVTAVHGAMKAAAEKAREQKRMGSSLECDVIIETSPKKNQTNGHDQSFLNAASAQELASILVVSDVQIREGVFDESTEDMEKADAPVDEVWQYTAPIELRDGRRIGRVIVSRARAHKCPRCWRFVADEEDKPCNRCEDALRERENATQ